MLLFPIYLNIYTKGVDTIYIFSKKISVSLPCFLNANYNKHNYLILDIETTGLSPKDSEVILVGIIYYTNNEWYLTQIFCDHRTEEPLLLMELMKYIHKNHLLITYNGHAFDLPYLNKRYAHHKIDFKIDLNKNFDLYRVVRASKKALNLKNYKLKTIEEYLGIFRTDQISGKESVELYGAYEAYPKEDLRETILLHNSDDIEFMIPTLKILDDIPIVITEKYYPFIHFEDGYGQLTCIHYKEEKNYIEVDFSTSLFLDSVSDYNVNYHIEYLKHIIHVKLPIFYIDERKFLDIDNITFLNEAFNELS